LIYVYGSKDKKLYIKGFNKNDKQNFWTWTSKTEFTPLNEATASKVNDVIIDHVYKDHNNYFILMYNIGTDNNIYQKLLFVSNGSEVLKEYNLTDNRNPFTFGDEINDWYGNSFLINTHVNFGNNIGREVIRCYNFNGEVIFDTTMQDYINSYYLPLNIEESLFFKNKSIKRHNLKTNTIVWESDKIENIPDNALIDNVTFEAASDDFTKCTIKYTSNGTDKKIFTATIDNQTGNYLN
jgi:hypothetical protein